MAKDFNRVCGEDIDVSVRMAEKLSYIGGVSLGAFSGIIEVCALQPTTAWKNALQQRLPVPFHPSRLYRGVLINSLSVAPMTAAQFGSYAAISTIFPEAHPLLKAWSAGLASAVFAAPSELIVIHQQRWNAPLIESTKRIFRKTRSFRSFFKAFTLTAARDCTFTLGYLGIAPLIQDQISTTVFGSVVGSAAAGLVIVSLAHPFDTMKTRMQAELQGTEFVSPLKTARSLWTEGGVSALYRGFVPVLGRVSATVFILNECRNRLAPYFYWI